MLHRKVFETILANESLFIPSVFTKKQIEIIKSKINGKKLDMSDRKQLYTSIRKKAIALSLIANPAPFFINAKHPISERIERAIRILSNLPFEQSFIGGSFLFRDNYNDIDIFVIHDRLRGEEKKENLHITYLPKKALRNPVIQSIGRSSISKFLMPPEFDAPKLDMFDYMNIFQEAALAIFKGKEEAKDIRDIIFYDSYFRTDELISSEELIRRCDEFAGLDKKKKLNALKDMIKTIFKRYNPNYLKRELRDYSKTLDNEISEFKLNEHLKYYKETYQEAIYSA